jgi:serine/threonine protein kinase
MSDLIGKSISQYQIVEQIGLGGMATVYKAYQPAIDRYVAVKILPRELASDPNFVKRFQHEAKAIAALEHPHILPVHDFGTDEGYTYMVMRYVEGGTLADMMGRPSSNERIVQIVGNVAKALDYAHQQGVVHRDIKPSNILIDQHDEVLLTDFGIAKMIEGAGDTQLTSAGSILGTPAYMAPEQAEAKPVDGRTDIYSLGVVLYELLTGQPPYRAETPLAIVLKHMNEPLPPPRTVKADVPEPFEQVVLKAMAKDPNRRFQTAADMEKALRQALKKIEASPATGQISSPITQTEGLAAPTGQTGQSKRSLMPLFLVGGLVALLLCVVGVGVVGWVLMAASEDIDRATPTSVTLLQTTPTAVIEDSSPTPTVPPLSSPTPIVDSSVNSPPGTGGEILFEEYFESDANGWATGEFEDEYTLDEISIEDGQYILSVTAREAAYIEKKLPNQEFSDFILTIEATPHDTEEHYSYGLSFRLNDNSYGYTFEIGNDRLYTVLLYEDEWISLKEWSSTEAINIGETNEIMIVAAGSRLSFYVNGEQLTTLEDDTVASGQIALVLDMLEDDTSATVSFDNLIIQALDNSP